MARGGGSIGADKRRNSAYPALRCRPGPDKRRNSAYLALRGRPGPDKRRNSAYPALRSRPGPDKRRNSAYPALRGRPADMPPPLFFRLAFQDGGGDVVAHLAGAGRRAMDRFDHVFAKFVPL